MKWYAVEARDDFVALADHLERVRKAAKFRKQNGKMWILPSWNEALNITNQWGQVVSRSSHAIFMNCTAENI